MVGWVVGSEIKEIFYVSFSKPSLNSCPSQEFLHLYSPGYREEKDDM